GALGTHHLGEEAVEFLGGEGLPPLGPGADVVLQLLHAGHQPARLLAGVVVRRAGGGRVEVRLALGEPAEHAPPPGHHYQEQGEGQEYRAATAEHWQTPGARRRGEYPGRATGSTPTGMGGGRVAPATCDRLYTLCAITGGKSNRCVTRVGPAAPRGGV